ncbi:Uncharacterized protein APZ42_025940 [Daphnia magna]|uniref:RNA-directed DNA polymerase n=1 Tax=Daphnia magna TaxID=35525 RepID=A0A162EE99_9CRUS|nr:Uncharacterized protein APZ42_025940 [Daphnia magna]
MVREQSKDPLCSDIQDYLENGTLSEENSNQIWAKRKPVFIRYPTACWKSLLQEYHDSPLSGNLAYQRTVLRLRDKYYWPTMLSDVKEFPVTHSTHSLQGNNHVLVITDYFTKWVEVIALPDQTAMKTSKALMDKVILNHGSPKAIVTDQGSNFTSELFSSLCKKTAD